jgi:hypothetical protein
VNEFIEVTFRRGNKRLRVKRQVPGGIEFDERDPIERTVGLQLMGRDDATKERMRRIAQVKGWDPGTFKLNPSVEDGNLRLRGVDADALPLGFYALKVEIEEAECKQATRNLKIEQDRFDTLIVDVTLDDREVAVDLDDSDDQIKRVLDASRIDGLDASSWLQSPDWRAARKACLLNLLATLRVRPKVSAGLIEYILSTFSVFNDRAFMKVDKSLLPRIQELVLDPGKPFYAEGSPTAPIHQRLLRDIPEPPEVKAKFTGGLLSFRGERKGAEPSLQMVIAVPPVDLAYTYAEFDLDLGNPLQDVLGFVVHMQELLDGKPTSHLDLRARLAKTSAKDYLYYTIT